MHFFKTLSAIAMGGLAVSAMPAGASTITDGFTFAVASGSGAPATGSHFHSNTGGVFGNPAGKAEVGKFSGETVRGLSEYNIGGLTMSPTAFVTFDVYKAGGLFPGVNDTAFTGPITIYAYQGNNLENISDYEAAPFATIATFNVAPGMTSIADIFSFDITSAFNSAIGNGYASLGIRLQADGLDASQAWTFENFRLTSDNETMGGVPEPTTWMLMLVGFGAVGGALRRRPAEARKTTFA